MSEKYLMPNLNLPKFLYFIHGFLSGRAKMAGLDSESNTLISGFVTEKTKQYASISHDRVKKLEDETKSVRSEALHIMIEEAQIQTKLHDLQRRDDQTKAKLSKSPESVAEHRAARGHKADQNQLHGRKSDLKKKHDENIKRLGEIKAKLHSCELTAKEELEITANKLQSVLAAYAKGVLLKPVKPEYIPELERYDFHLYKESHEAEELLMNKLLQEVFDYE